MFQSFSKIWIVVAVAVFAVAGIFCWQYFSAQKETEISEEKIGEILEEEKSEVPTEKKNEGNTYLSPDNFLHAQIISAGETQESIIQIYTKDNILLQKLDYTSEDGGHGLVVRYASWTPDSKFFIYSAYSSGGHQPWFSRVYFYSKSDNEIYYFQDISGFTATNDEFTVTPPDIISLTVYASVGMGPTTRKSFNLSEIISKKNKTDDWKTYRNDEYRFEVEYPQNWVLSAHNPSYLCIEGPDYNCLASIQFSPPMPLVKTLKDIDLVITTNPNNYSVGEWIEKYTPEILSDPQTSLYKDLKIGENKWTKLLIIEDMGSQRVAFSVVEKQKMYSLSTFIGQGMEEAENVLNQMLSSFRFLE